MQMNLLVMLCLLLGCISGFAQEAAPAGLGRQVAELDKAIWMILRAKNNDHWFGSDGQGVFRYDGKVLTQFTTKDGLAHDQVRGIQEDHAGNIYITTNGGFSKFDGKKFTTLPVVDGSEDDWKLSTNDLWFSAGAPYRYDGKSLYRLKLPTKKKGEEWNAKYPREKFPRRSSPYDVYSLYKDNKGNMWFGTGVAGVRRYDGKSFAWIDDEAVTEFHNGPSNGVRSIIEDKEGIFWLCTTQFRYDIYGITSAKSDEQTKVSGDMKYRQLPGIGSLDEKDPDFNEYLSAVKDEMGDLWIASYGGGVFRYDGRKLTHYPVMEGENVITIVSIYRDKQGDLWLGTHEHGAMKFNGKTFERFSVGK